MGKPGCYCEPLFNLAKMNPLTGAWIWRRRIRDGIVSGSNEYITQIEPLHGTNDILIVTTRNTNDTHLMRIRGNSGRIDWRISIAPLQNLATVAKTVGCDSSGRIVTTAFPLVSSQVRSIQGIDPFNGANLWTVAYAGTQVRSLTSGATDALVNFFASTGQPSRRKVDPVTGATVWFMGNPGENNYTMTAEDSGGDIISADYSGGLTRRFNAAGVFTASATWRATRARFGYGGYSAAMFGSSPYALATGGTSLTTTFALSSIGGASLASKLNDTCSGNNGSGSPLYYYTGLGMTGTGGVVWNIFCVDAAGALVWAQPWGSVSPSGLNVMACGISDDGYLYTGGVNGTI